MTDGVPEVPPPIPVVDAWLQTVPAGLQDRLMQLRTLIHEVAIDEDAWPLVEEIKWGQPSYRSPHRNESTPVRLGWTRSGEVALLTHCQSRVIPEFRRAFGDRFRFDGDRAVLVDPAGELYDAELAELIRHALTYRR